MHSFWNPEKKISVAMSGGVDSSVTVCLLKRQGYDVRGVFMALAQPDLDEQIERVRKVAAILEVKLDVVDFSQKFEKQVLDYFRSAYFAGKTPNPCIICNPTIKFGELLAWVRKKAGGFLATGHYVRIQHCEGEVTRIFKGRDETKDQSYFLCRLTQEQLRRLYFPLGELRKKEVYGLAAEFGISKVHGKESQDVCFLQNRSVRDFLAEASHMPPQAGPIVLADGKKVGEHNGVHHFTVGQRRGLGIPDKTPYYVVTLDAAANTVMIGKESDLWRKELIAVEMNWSAGIEPVFTKEFEVKIRYRHKGDRAVITPLGDGAYKIVFREPQRAVTPGQYAVIYDGEELIGGGEIIR